VVSNQNHNFCCTRLIRSKGIASRTASWWDYLRDIASSQHSYFVGIYLLHMIENTFDRKRIYANPALTLTLTRTLILKRNYVFGLTK